jgi:DNA-binding transcriptional ArsR family regulator
MDDLRRLINGYQVSQAIHVAATLGIADLLADGSRTSDELAEATGSHPRALYRLLRALAAAGVLHEDEKRSFALSELGAQLRSDVPDSLHGWASFVGRPYYWNAWAHLAESIRNGENTFKQVYAESVWEYRAKRPEESEIFDRAMSALTGASNAAILDAYDFGRFETVVDVGGGNGALLAGILDRHPAVRGVVFDQPHVVANARAFLAERGLADRCEVSAGSFFDSVPSGADAYVLKTIIHDWEDPEAEAILHTCRRAMGPTAMLLVIEQELGGPNERPPAKFSDLNMLVAPGGQERTRDEYATLFAATGFELTRTIPTAGTLQVFEAAPVS